MATSALRGADDDLQLRLSAFRFPFFRVSFRSFFPFVIAGHSRSKERRRFARLCRQSMRKSSLCIFPEVCRRETSAWTAGSSPAVTRSKDCRATARAQNRAARTMRLIRPRDSGGGGPPVARLSERRVVQGASTLRLRGRIRGPSHRTLCERRLTNFAMPHMWRSAATTKPWQLQQMAEARPDSAVTNKA